jgi:hypothetical protein
LNIGENVAENPPFRKAGVSPLFLNNGQVKRWLSLLVKTSAHWQWNWNLKEAENVWTVVWNSMKGGSSAISEYKCSRIALKAAMG